MFEKLAPQYIIPYNDADVNENLTLLKIWQSARATPGSPGRSGPGALDDNIIIATYLTIKKGM